jgi:SAP domain-containing new25
MVQKKRLSVSMTEKEFDNGYWYASELRRFAVKMRIPSANKLRKDELEKALKHFIRTGESRTFAKRAFTKRGIRDVDLGLSLELPVINYTSNKETKTFIEREAAKIEPSFARASGTRYLLNRWREEQLSAGRRIRYRDLIKQAIELNKAKRSPLRLDHGRYINFVSDFMASNENALRGEAIKAWEELKSMDTPKTYASWVKARRIAKAMRD